MAFKTLNTRIQNRADTAANWRTANPILQSGEVGIETDTQKTKVGNGTDRWNSLEYVGSHILDNINPIGSLAAKKENGMLNISSVFGPEVQYGNLFGGIDTIAFTDYSTERAVSYLNVAIPDYQKAIINRIKFLNVDFDFIFSCKTFYKTAPFFKAYFTPFGNDFDNIPSYNNSAAMVADSTLNYISTAARNYYLINNNGYSIVENTSESTYQYIDILPCNCSLNDAKTFILYWLNIWNQINNSLTPTYGTEPTLAKIDSSKPAFVSCLIYDKFQETGLYFCGSASEISNSSWLDRYDENDNVNLGTYYWTIQEISQTKIPYDYLDIPIDTTVTQGSTNLPTSGAVYNAIQASGGSSGGSNNLEIDENEKYLEIDSTGSTSKLKTTLGKLIPKYNTISFTMNQSEELELDPPEPRFQMVNLNAPQEHDTFNLVLKTNDSEIYNGEGEWELYEIPDEASVPIFTYNIDVDDAAMHLMTLVGGEGDSSLSKINNDPTKPEDGFGFYMVYIADESRAFAVCPFDELNNQDYEVTLNILAGKQLLQLDGNLVEGTLASADHDKYIKVNKDINGKYSFGLALGEEIPTYGQAVDLNSGHILDYFPNVILKPNVENIQSGRAQTLWVGAGLPNVNDSVQLLIEVNGVTQSIDLAWQQITSSTLASVFGVESSDFLALVYNMQAADMVSWIESAVSENEVAPTKGEDGFAFGFIVIGGGGGAFEGLCACPYDSTDDGVYTVTLKIPTGTEVVKIPSNCLDITLPTITSMITNATTQTDVPTAGAVQDFVISNKISVTTENDNYIKSEQIGNSYKISSRFGQSKVTTLGSATIDFKAAINQNLSYEGPNRIAGGEWYTTAPTKGDTIEAVLQTKTKSLTWEFGSYNGDSSLIATYNIAADSGNNLTAADIAYKHFTETLFSESEPQVTKSDNSDYAFYFIYFGNNIILVGLPSNSSESSDEQTINITKTTTIKLPSSYVETEDSFSGYSNHIPNEGAITQYIQSQGYAYRDISNTFSKANTFSGNNTFSGENTFNPTSGGANTFNGYVKFSSTQLGSSSLSISDGNLYSTGTATFYGPTQVTGLISSNIGAFNIFYKRAAGDFERGIYFSDDSANGVLGQTSTIVRPDMFLGFPDVSETGYKTKIYYKYSDDNIKHYLAERNSSLSNNSILKWDGTNSKIVDGYTVITSLSSSNTNTELLGAAALYTTLGNYAKLQSSNDFTNVSNPTTQQFDNIYVKNIYQNGSNYITHAETIYSENSLITLRCPPHVEFTGDGTTTTFNIIEKPTTLTSVKIDGTAQSSGYTYNSSTGSLTFTTAPTSGAKINVEFDNIVAMGSNEFAGFQIHKYNGTTDGYLVFDKDGYARVGTGTANTTNLQPLATRAESTELSSKDGHIMVWDASAEKLVAGYKIVVISQSDYDNLGTKDPNTLYFIQETTGA